MMNNIWHLSKKEALEFLRTSKFIWIPIVFILMCVVQPITLYYMEDILKASNSIPKGFPLDMPLPTSGEAMYSSLSQFSTIGTLIIIGTTMATIFEEYNKGQATLLFVRPVSKTEYVISKWLSYSLLFLISFIISFFVTYYYVEILFGSIPINILMNSLALSSLWIVFVVALTLLCSSIFKSNGAVFGVSTLVCALLGLLQSLIPAKMAFSPTNLFSIVLDVINMKSNDDIFITVGCTLAIIVFLNVFTILVLKKKVVHS